MERSALATLADVMKVAVVRTKNVERAVRARKQLPKKAVLAIPANVLIANVPKARPLVCLKTFAAKNYNCHIF